MWRDDLKYGRGGASKLQQQRLCRQNGKHQLPQLGPGVVDGGGQVSNEDSDKDNGVFMRARHHHPSSTEIQHSSPTEEKPWRQRRMRCCKPDHARTPRSSAHWPSTPSWPQYRSISDPWG